MSKCTMKVCAEDPENGLECPWWGFLSCRRWTDFQGSWQVVFCSLFQLFSQLTSLGILYSAPLHEHFYVHLEYEGSENWIQHPPFFLRKTNPHKNFCHLKRREKHVLEKQTSLFQPCIMHIISFLKSSSNYFFQSTTGIVTLHPVSLAKFSTTTSPLSCHNNLVLDTYP